MGLFEQESQAPPGEIPEVLPGLFSKESRNEGLRQAKTVRCGKNQDAAVAHQASSESERLANIQHVLEDFEHGDGIERILSELPSPLLEMSFIDGEAFGPRFSSGSRIQLEGEGLP